MRYAISYENDALNQPVLVLNLGSQRLATFAKQETADLLASILNAHEGLYAAVKASLPLLQQLDSDRQMLAASLEMGYTGMPELNMVEDIINQLEGA